MCICIYKEKGYALMFASGKAGTFRDDFMFWTESRKDYSLLGRKTCRVERALCIFAFEEIFMSMCKVD